MISNKLRNSAICWCPIGVRGEGEVGMKCIAQVFLAGLIAGRAVPKLI